MPRRFTRSHDSLPKARLSPAGPQRSIAARTPTSQGTQHRSCVSIVSKPRSWHAFVALGMPAGRGAGPIRSMDPPSATRGPPSRTCARGPPARSGTCRASRRVQANDGSGVLLASLSAGARKAINAPLEFVGTSARRGNRTNGRTPHVRRHAKRVVPDARPTKRTRPGSLRREVRVAATSGVFGTCRWLHRIRKDHRQAGAALDRRSAMRYDSHLFNLSGSAAP